MAYHLHDAATASDFLATSQLFISNYRPQYIGGHIMSAYMEKSWIWIADITAKNVFM